MTSLLDSLEAKARAATQSGRTERGSEVYNARAALIAACSPETILKLIAVAKAAQAWAESDECDKFLPNKRRETEIFEALALEELK